MFVDKKHEYWVKDYINPFWRFHWRGIYLLGQGFQLDMKEIPPSMADHAVIKMQKKKNKKKTKKIEMVCLIKSIEKLLPVGTCVSVSWELSIVSDIGMQKR